MTLVLTPIDHDQLCYGWQWEIADEDILADRVARVAVGQFRHVARILDGANILPPATQAMVAQDAIAALTLAVGSDPWHRDGWLFQTISWIAAYQNKKGAIINAPHIRKADKGFDGFQLEISADGQVVTAVIIFEDKATSDARRTIREEVWPGIEILESGSRVTELTHQASALLEGQLVRNPDLDIDSAVANILWKEARCYRVSITIDETHVTAAARKRLFKDFDLKAPGVLQRRRAETIHIPLLREWMEGFAQRVVAAIRVMAANV